MGRTRVLRGCRPLRWLAGQRRPGMLRAAVAVLVVLASVTAATSCAGAAWPGQQAHLHLAAWTRLPGPGTSVLAGAADVVAGSLAQELFASAPVVVVASPGRPAELAAARWALRARAPLLLASAQAGGAVASVMMRAQVKALDPRAVLAVGWPGMCSRLRQPARPGQEVPVAARAARCRAGSGPGVETGAGAGAEATDRQRAHQRGQQRHQMAGWPSPRSTGCRRSSWCCTSSGCR